MLCYAGYAMLCYVMLCYAALRYAAGDGDKARKENNQKKRVGCRKMTKHRHRPVRQSGFHLHRTSSCASASAHQAMASCRAAPGQAEAAEAAQQRTTGHSSANKSRLIDCPAYYCLLRRRRCEVQTLPIRTVGILQGANDSITKAFYAYLTSNTLHVRHSTPLGMYVCRYLLAGSRLQARIISTSKRCTDNKSSWPYYRGSSFTHMASTANKYGLA
ncbi:hypothetical protein F4803DRAFT_435975 [Xylaria telfairii]|nr:hypothetical protein F4803DRAFT_435975 [Xylaria telfairii]